MLDACDVSRAHVPYVEEISLRVQVADSDDRRLEPACYGRDMAREGWDDKSRALTGTGVVEGTDTDNTQALIRHDPECKVCGGLRCSIHIQWG